MWVHPPFLCVLLFLLSTMAVAQEAPVTDCDRLVTSEFEPERKSIWVPHDQIDPVLAASACEIAVHQYPNSVRLIYQLGRAYLKAGKINDALVRYRTAAEKGLAQAQTGLGNLYFIGTSVPRDYGMAFNLYRKAAEQGDAEGQYNLGYIYRHGSGVPQDSQQAVAWFHKAADQGWGEAQSSLGYMYYTGSGVPMDYHQAFSWYHKAADQGIAAAQHSLGIMYEHGYGVAQDGEQSRQWYRKAADQGYKDSLERLAAGPVPFPEDQSAPLVAHAPPASVRFPNQWVYDDILTGSYTRNIYQPYFQCDYTTQTCIKGRKGGNDFFGEILAKDRSTAIAHINCHGSFCINYETGLNTYGEVSLKEDLPEVCVKVLRDFHELCDQRPVAIGSLWRISEGVVRCRDRNYQGLPTRPGCYSGFAEEVIVDKVDSGSLACVHAQGQSDCVWVVKNNLSGPLPDQRSPPR
jgi:hypothetical protein